jgi:hypothetical protein
MFPMKIRTGNIASSSVNDGAADSKNAEVSIKVKNIKDSSDKEPQEQQEKSSAPADRQNTPDKSNGDNAVGNDSKESPSSDEDKKKDKIQMISSSNNNKKKNPASPKKSKTAAKITVIACKTVTVAVNNHLRHHQVKHSNHSSVTLLLWIFKSFF